MPRGTATTHPHLRLGNWGNLEEVLVGCGALLLDLGLASVVSGGSLPGYAMADYIEWNTLARRMHEAVKRTQGLRDEIVSLGLDNEAGIVKQLFLSDEVKVFVALSPVVGNVKLNWDMNEELVDCEGGGTGIRTGVSMWIREEMSSKLTAYSLADRGMEDDTSAGSAFLGYWYDVKIASGTDHKLGAAISGLDTGTTSSGVGSSRL